MGNENLVKRVDMLEKTLEYMQIELHKKITGYEEKVSLLETKSAKLEEVATLRGERMDNLMNQMKTLERYLEKMEYGLLNEFKISQEIMKNMLSHDMSIEKTRQDWKIEQERRESEWEQQQRELEAELLNKQRTFEMESKKQRAEMLRNLYIKIGAVGLPILTALSLAISQLIEKFL